jgi:hypothetical protein
VGRKCGWESSDEDAGPRSSPAPAAVGRKCESSDEDAGPRSSPAPAAVGRKSGWESSDEDAGPRSSPTRSSPAPAAPQELITPTNNIGTQTGICLGSFGYTIGCCHTVPFESEYLDKSIQTCCEFLPNILIQELNLVH